MGFLDNDLVDELEDTVQRATGIDLGGSGGGRNAADVTDSEPVETQKQDQSKEENQPSKNTEEKPQADKKQGETGQDTGSKSSNPVTDVAQTEDLGDDVATRTAVMPDDEDQDTNPEPVGEEDTSSDTDTGGDTSVQDSTGSDTSDRTSTTDTGTRGTGQETGVDTEGQDDQRIVPKGFGDSTEESYQDRYEGNYSDQVVAFRTRRNKYGQPQGDPEPITQDEAQNLDFNPGENNELTAIRRGAPERKQDIQRKLQQQQYEERKAERRQKKLETRKRFLKNRRERLQKLYTKYSDPDLSDDDARAKNGGSTQGFNRQERLKNRIEKIDSRIANIDDRLEYAREFDDKAENRINNLSSMLTQTPGEETSQSQESQQQGFPIDSFDQANQSYGLSDEEARRQLFQMLAERGGAPPETYEQQALATGATRTEITDDSGVQRPARQRYEALVQQADLSQAEFNLLRSVAAQQSLIEQGKWIGENFPVTEFIGRNIATAEMGAREFADFITGEDEELGLTPEERGRLNELINKRQKDVGIGVTGPLQLAALGSGAVSGVRRIASGEAEASVSNQFQQGANLVAKDFSKDPVGFLTQEGVEEVVTLGFGAGVTPDVSLTAGATRSPSFEDTPSPEESPQFAGEFDNLQDPGESQTPDTSSDRRNTKTDRQEAAEENAGKFYGNKFEQQRMDALRRNQESTGREGQPRFPADLETDTTTTEFIKGDIDPEIHKEKILEMRPFKEGEARVRGQEMKETVKEIGTVRTRTRLDALKEEGIPERASGDASDLAGVEFEPSNQDGLQPADVLFNTRKGQVELVEPETVEPEPEPDTGDTGSTDVTTPEDRRTAAPDNFERSSGYPEPDLGRPERSFDTTPDTETGVKPQVTPDLPEDQIQDQEQQQTQKQQQQPVEEDLPQVIQEQMPGEAPERVFDFLPNPEPTPESTSDFEPEPETTPDRTFNRDIDLDFGGQEDESTGKKSEEKRPNTEEEKGYTPSLAAGLFDITVSEEEFDTSGTFSGIGVRPIVVDTGKDAVDDVLAEDQRQ